jgi:hypothetical protein
MASKNQKLLLDFSVYCAQHPEERFWQALRNWSEGDYIYVEQHKDTSVFISDTFYFKGKNK